jgi:outer membrane protein TolC
MPALPSRGAVAALLLASACVAAPAGAVDLEQVLAEVAAANPALAAQQSEVAAARAHARRVGAWDAPMLELSAVNVPTSGGFDQDPMTMRMLGVEQRVDVFGARGLARRAAQGDARAAGAQAGAARWDRFADAWEAYGDAYFSAQRAAGALAHRAVADHMVAAARARYEVGRGRLDELLRAEAERARLAADGATFDAEEHSARARLDALRGREPGARADSLAAPPEWLAADSAAGWRDVIGAHPKLLALREREAARRTAADAARRMVWPELSLHAAYGFRQTLADGTPQDDMWSAGVEFMLPLGTGSRQGAEAAEMSAMADAAALERRGEALDLGADLATMRGQAAAARRVVRMLADTVLVAQQRALAAAWSAYESGSTDLSGVLEAAHASYAVELDVTRARQELARTLARLLAVTARGDLLGVRVPPPGEGRQP